MNLFDSLFPMPENILTDYTVNRLNEINTGSGTALVNEVNQLKLQSQQAYANILPSIGANVSTLMVAAGLVALYLLLRK